MADWTTQASWLLETGAWDDKGVWLDGESFGGGSIAWLEVPLEALVFNGVPVTFEGEVVGFYIDIWTDTLLGQVRYQGGDVSYAGERVTFAEDIWTDVA